MSLQFSNDIKSNDNEHNFTVISKINNIFLCCVIFIRHFLFTKKKNLPPSGYEFFTVSFLLQEFHAHFLEITYFHQRSTKPERRKIINYKKFMEHFKFQHEVCLLINREIDFISSGRNFTIGNY